MTTQKKERKDWVLLIFIIPIGVLLLLFVGQWAIRLLPFWSVNAGMNSNLEPDTGAAHPFALLEPLLPQILIPLPWAETYLIPGDGEISFPPFLTFEPTASPVPTAVVATEDTPTPTATPTETATPTSTSVVATAPTNAGGGGEDPAPTDSSTPPATTCTDSLANNQGQPLPCTYPPTTCTDPLANNQGQPLPCTYPPVCPGAHNPNGPLPCDYGTVDTPDPSYVATSIPSEINIGTPDSPTNPSGIGDIIDGTYIVLTLNIVVEPVPDVNYDLVYYEYNNGGQVRLDWIIIGISNDMSGASYYEVFYWGNGNPDTNSNVGDVAGTEDDNQPTNLSELHDPDDPDGTNDNQTGILIDVDNAISNPPPTTYAYVVIISPKDSLVPLPNNGGSGEPVEVDAIQAVEVPIPPTP